MNLRILVHYDRILNAGKSGWARYMVLASFFLLLPVLLLAKNYLAALLLLPFAYGVLTRNWRTHIWLCFLLLFYFLYVVNKLAAAPHWLDYAAGFLIVMLFVAAMFYCRWVKEAP
jgi:uncharacterized membrane protein